MVVRLYFLSFHFEIRNATFDIWRKFKTQLWFGQSQILNLRNEGRRLYFHLLQTDFLLQIQTSWDMISQRINVQEGTNGIQKWFTIQFLIFGASRVASSNFLLKNFLSFLDYVKIPAVVVGKSKRIWIEKNLKPQY